MPAMSSTCSLTICMVTVNDVAVGEELEWSFEFQARLLPIFLQQHMDTIRPVEMQYGLMATRWQSSLTRGKEERGLRSWWEEEKQLWRKARTDKYVILYKQVHWSSIEIRSGREFSFCYDINN